jgi:prepilin-type N-terminal cleavage/methylation domain-containing protein
MEYHRARGFSLAELMIVVAMIGVMTAVAAPNISKSIRRSSEPIQVVRTHSFVLAARNLARRTNRCVKVTRSTDGKTLKAETFNTCAATASCRCRASSLADSTTTLDMTKQQPAAARITAFTSNTTSASDLTGISGTEVLIFLADGSTPYTAPVSIDVKLPEAGVKIIKVMPATGIVRMPGGA